MQAPTNKEDQDESIFALYNAEGKEEREKQREVSKRPKAAQAVREVGLGVAQGTGDIVEMATLPEAGINKLISMALGEEIYEDDVAPGQKARIETAYGDSNLTPLQQLQMLSDDDDLIPTQGVPGGRGKVTESLKEIPEEGALQEGVRRVTRSAPGLVAGPVVGAEMAVRDLVGMGGKEIGKQLGLPEWGQDAMDVLFSLAPNPTKLIKPTEKVIRMAATGKFTTQKELVEAAKKFGMNEEAIAPLVRDGWFSDLLAKASPRRGTVQKALHKTKEAVGNTFDVIKDSEVAAGKLAENAKKPFLKSIQKKLADLSTAERGAISGDLETLMKSDMTGRDMMVFWENVNSYFKEHPRLQGLKGPIRKALAAINPQMGRDYELLNTLSQRFRETASKLKPNIGTDIFGSTEAIGLIGGIISGNLPIIAGISATAGGRKLAQMMLTNPRFQNLHKKMITTINAGQIKATKQILDQMIGIIQKSSPETAAQLQTLSMEDLEKALKAED